MPTIEELFNLEGKVAIVTGGAGHLGTAVSEALAEAKAHVVIASRNVENCRALARRLTDKIHFPKPNASLRAAIWRRLLPDTAPVDDAIDFERLGKRFELAGGDIKNAVFKAAFRAANASGPLSQELLEEAGREVTDSYGNGGNSKVGFGRLA